MPLSQPDRWCGRKDCRTPDQDKSDLYGTWVSFLSGGTGYELAGVLSGGEGAEPMDGCVHEDYARAKKKFHAGKTYYLPGIGINLERFHAGDAQTIQQKRQELGLQPEDVFLLSVGELSDRKNHAVVIEAMKQLVQRHPQLRYFICGQGEKKQELQQLIRKYHLEDHVKLLGFRTDVAELCQAADVFVFPSKQEGLPVALMEAMACEVPVVCSRIRGNTDLVKNGENGYLVRADQPEEYIQAIEKFLQIWKNTEEVRQMRKNNRARIKQYSLQKIDKIMENIYR